MVRNFTHRRSPLASVVSGVMSSPTNNEGDKSKSSRQKQFLSLHETSVLFGITKRSVYNLIYSGVLQAFKLTSRLTIVRKTDIERMFEGHVYKKKVKPERKPITEFYTTSEIEEGWVFKIGKEKKIPKILHHGKTYWSKQHVEKHFAKHIENNSIAEWYSVADMMTKFNMTTSAVYCFVS